MKLLVLAAFVVAVSSGRLGSESNSADQQWPWQSGKVYKYDVESHTLASLPDSASTGSSYRARFVIRARESGKLDARLENAVHALVHKKLRQQNQISDEEENDYQPLSNLEKPFEINVNGGRIVSLNLPLGLPLAYENLLKGLIGSLQIDLSTYRNINSPGDNYDNDAKQGLFRKMETDVTGDCETLYSVSPSASEWRRELPKFANAEDPIAVTKSKSYDNCHHRVDYHFGVPEGVEWTGTTHSTKKEQLIKRSTVSRYLVGKNGPIYKAETTSIVHVSPLMFSKQKAEVHSKITIQLANFEDDNEPEWEKPEGGRGIENLLYSLTPKQVSIDGSSTSSESPDNEQLESRVRRSAKSKSISINKVIIQKHSGESSDSKSSSSSDDSRSTFVNDDVPKFNEPAYAALYMNSQPRGDKKQNPSNAQKLVQEMAQQLQNANNMPRADFLSKFNILVRVIASMSYGQLAQVSRNIEAAKDHEDEMKADMWRIYRDAVTQAGTLPAFQLIRSWIQEKKIRGEEAAEVVAVLPRSLRYPTKEAMIQFFELAMSPEVREEKNLNTSALIAATKFIHMGQVDNRTVHRYYPTHMYGRLSNQHDRFVLDDILPRLEAQLQLAIEQNDSHKAQVYIKAIGTLGHREILRVFSPYLEGKVPVSTYLRTQVIDALKTLARQKDRYVRSALYSILRNTAEPYEVRVAAIMNIFMTLPTEAMWQEMAEMTKRDPSQEVRAAIKSGILSAANLEHPRYFELARSAQGVRDMLTEENFGNQHSLKAIRSYGRDDDDVGIFGVWSAIGAEDSLIPKSIRYYLQNTVSGWKEETAVSIKNHGLRSQNGKHLEIEVGPGADSSNYNVKVFTNTKKISEGELTTYFDESEESPILEYYVQPDNVLVLKIKDNRLRIMYDGQRLVVLSAQGRGQNRGICGQMSGKRRDDYMTPYGLVDNPDHYAASFALNDENPEPRTRQLQAEAKQMAYQRQNKYTAILRSDENWQNSQSENMKWDDSGVYNARSYSKKKVPCKMQKQVQYYENYGEICITTKPLPVCQPYCNVEDYKVQAAQVVCHPKMDPQFITYRNQIRQGLNPKVSGAPESRQYRVPASCKA
ncbi:vitellogenin-like [Pieris napi]|uniref:vitellogenin-like n=1 Tax=Pieris napi TaxID=78633 RepID=UPI001FBB3DC9|nr:vitellogenin-like [Pieris napi]